jgi:hypothetical protein
VKKGKAEKDPNKPFRLAVISDGFLGCLCRDSFRKEYKEKNPNNKQVSVVSTAHLFPLRFVSFELLFCSCGASSVI